MLLLVFTSCVGTSQNEEVKEDFNKYISAIQDKEYEKALDLTIPSIFHLVSRKQLSQSWRAAVSTPGMDMIIGDVEILAVNELQDVEDTAYKTLEYNQNLKMRFDEKTMNDSGASQDEFLKQTETAIKAQFGEENVSLDPNTMYFTIKSNKKVLAAQPEDAEHWQFMVLEKGNENYIKQLIPETTYNEVYNEK
ncbi:hypothetical protein [Nonlabens ponticola]|uniref:Uncharacterized protein n=1 Tax=Nonlabens ponticola TaxID=2496866 RepID=A0A3S9MXQ0_9FLAO|nr:hypothetical protein [Nonlabens ponticola]AZQ43909.1 hypothetical protein EJ995_06565 [Nonlabens ponticola]